MTNEYAPPSDLEIEQQVIGSILLENVLYFNYKDKLHSDLFYNEKYRIVFTAIEKIVEQKEDPTIITVTQYLKKTKQLEYLGGAYGVTKLTNNYFSLHSEFDFAVRILIDTNAKRKLITVSKEVLQSCYINEEPVGNLIYKLSDKLKVLDKEIVEERIESTEELFDATIQSIYDAKDNKGIIGLPIHIQGLNENLHGWQKGFVYVIAARPGVGKSSLTKSAIIGCVLKQIKCKIFSLEMTKKQMMTVILSELAEIPNNRIYNGQLSNEEITRLNSFKDIISPYLEIDDKAGITLPYLESQVRKFAQEGGELVALDYLQLMKSTGNFRNREQEISTFTREIKRIAKEYNIAMIEISQLNRAVEGRGGDKRPKLSDLRESGSIEQDAEVVILIHRPEVDGIFVDGKGNSLVGVAKAIIAKNRFGALTDVNMRFTDNLTRYDDYPNYSQSQLKIEEITNPEEDLF